MSPDYLSKVGDLVRPIHPTECRMFLAPFIFTQLSRNSAYSYLSWGAHKWVN